MTIVALHLPRGRSKGMALVMVLSCIVLISMLIVSFLALVRSDQQSSAAFSISAEARLLGDIPINMAIGQIRRGSEQLGYRQTWASQPGMIRTYGLENDGTGLRAKATGLFKLYSDDKMVVNNSNVTPTTGGLSRDAVEDAIDEDIHDLATWNTKPAMFTDLNEPSPFRHPSTGAIDLSFPIVDPRALTPGSGALPVEGFDYDESAVPGAVKPAGLTDTRTRLPMPVKWIYILKDGSFTVPTSATATTATFGPVNTPTVDNPIVARVAFWTDDESTKVNINTASEGTPWYTPITTNTTDRQYAERLPAHFEYSRAPGHPAQVSLSPIFQAFDADLAVPHGLSDSEKRDRLAFYHTINPRLQWGGTKGGTQVAPLGEELPQKTDRLYTSLDELLLTTDRKLQSPSITSSRLPLVRFFLSPHARAPEMTLFNKFRFSLWPNWRDTGQRSQVDNFMELINSSGVRGGGSSYGSAGAFDRGLGWSFLRNSSFNPTNNNSGSSQVSEGDASDYPSNMERLLTGVLGQMTGSPVTGSTPTLIPAFGNRTFIDKYTKARRDQILVSMMDVLRFGVDSYRPVSGTKRSYSPAQTTPNRVGEYSVVPMRVNTTGVIGRSRGVGRFPTITEVAMVFMATQANPTGHASQMQAFLILEPFSPHSGPPAWSGNLHYRIKGLETFQVTRNGPPQFLFNQAEIVDKVNFNPSLMAGGNKTPFPGLLAQFARTDRTTFANKVPGSAVPGTGYPFLSNAIPISAPVADGDLFQFSGGDITIEILRGWEEPTATSVPLQIIRLNFPATSLRVPQIRDSDGTTYNTLRKRLELLPDGPNWNTLALIRNGDTVRSVEASYLPTGVAKGDLRFYASLYEVPSSLFMPGGRTLYNQPNQERVHSLRDGAWSPNEERYNRDNAPTTPAARGRLLTNLDTNPLIRPAAIEGLVAARKRDNMPGDWDNGIGDIEDGPYMNRADTGSRWFGPDGGYYGRGKGTNGPDEHYHHSFSTHRNAPSAAIFGAIPTGIDPLAPDDVAKNFPWQTLLFCPNPPSRKTSSLSEPTAADHAGFAAPRDHLLLDFFWMPAIQPYAISESLSSAGRINMNYRILPFTHIERSTGIHAAMKATRVTAISRNSVTALNHYKIDSNHSYETQYSVNVPETLTGFKLRFDDKHDIFRSASEICEIFLVPEKIPGATYASDVPDIPGYAGMNAWWNGVPTTTSTHALDVTGDNAREAPYNALYPLLTTRSNTFTVHYRVQTLTKARSTAADVWVENQDVVSGEHRGSATLERYLDPNNYQIASINQGGGKFADSWDGFFRFRIINRQDFAP